MWKTIPGDEGVAGEAKPEHRAALGGNGCEFVGAESGRCPPGGAEAAEPGAVTAGSKRTGRSRRGGRGKGHKGKAAQAALTRTLSEAKARATSRCTRAACSTST